MAIPRGRLGRWSVPAIAAVGIAGVGVVPSALSASGHPSLPGRSAAQLLVAVERSHVTAMSGTIRTTANLGLPSLPAASTGGNATGLQTLLTGTHTLRIWLAGPARQRLALLGDLAETDVIHNGRNLWVYESATNTVTHRMLGPHARRAARHRDLAEAELTPQAEAKQALRAIDPTTRVTVGPTARVAGRRAYQLLLTPRTSATLVSSVRIAIDAATSVPLRVQVFARGTVKPAWETAFTKVSFATPAASVFRFTPPRGATVKSGPAIRPNRERAGDHMARPFPRAAAGRHRPMTIGTGWATILELPRGTLLTPGATRGQAGMMLDRLTNRVPQGRLLTTRLLSVLITNDGRVLVGAVPGAALQHAAATGR
jgi:outer membrane lipoprotein-sorting protein